jgi:hypothetical protein
VAVGAAYVSYRHGRDFALRFGADETTATAESIVETAMLVDKSVWGGVARARTGHLRRGQVSVTNSDRLVC